MRWIEVAKTEAAAHRLTVQFGYAPQPPPRPHQAPLGQLGLPFTGRLRRLGSHPALKPKLPSAVRDPFARGPSPTVVLRERPTVPDYGTKGQLFS
jgi:hypothetical protein